MCDKCDLKLLKHFLAQSFMYRKLIHITIFEYLKKIKASKIHPKILIS